MVAVRRHDVAAPSLGLEVVRGRAALAEAAQGGARQPRSAIRCGLYGAAGARPIRTSSDRITWLSVQGGSPASSAALRKLRWVTMAAKARGRPGTHVEALGTELIQRGIHVNVFHSTMTFTTRLSEAS